MISLYQWLLENKGYSEAEAEETLFRFDYGLEMPKEVLFDIKEYTQEFIERYHGGFSLD